MKYFAFIAIIGVLASCSPVKKGLLNNQEAPVFEIAVRKVKNGAAGQVLVEREKVIMIEPFEV